MMRKEIIDQLMMALSDTYGSEPLFLVASLDEELERLKLRVGVDRAPSTLRTMKVVRKHVSNYILCSIGQQDLAMSSLTPSFIEHFSSYLNTVEKLSSTTIWAYTTPLKRLLRRAHQEGRILCDPFASFHITPHVKGRIFLTASELQRMIQLPLEERTLRFVRDMFVFASLTGLSFIDLQLLKHQELVFMYHEAWIISHRQKTHTPFQVRLLPIPLRILHQWSTVAGSPGTPVFPLYGYKRMSRKLKRIVELCGIDKRVTWHTARHTFATLALNNGMPIESVSRVLGHTKISTTQIYAQLSLEKLGRDFEALGHNLSFNEK